MSADARSLLRELALRPGSISGARSAALELHGLRYIATVRAGYWYVTDAGWGAL